MLKEKNIKKDAPLAERMKPESLDEFFGQEHILGKGKLLRRAIQADKITSLILYGSPGTGKTSLAKVIANSTKANFVNLNAVTSGIKELKEVVKEAENILGMYNKKTILFIDEIHRFNKSQQDALLPYVENGTLTLIGATTENPYFEVNAALLSRSMLFLLKPLDKISIKKMIQKAITDSKKGLGMLPIYMEENAFEFLVDISNGDGRRALNTLELGVLTTPKGEDGKIHITLDVLQDCVQKKHVTYDKNGNEHYDVISAFIKSMRGSDPDATLHYLARMLYAGEDPVFIARRIVIAAAEDVGLADPNAIVIANNAAQAVKFVGMPEARIILSQASLYIATAPKSNKAYEGINQALKDIERKDIGQVPPHLRDMTSQNIQNKYNDKIKGCYLYPHDYEGAYVKQQYMPDPLKNTKYYFPKENGYEKNIVERLKWTTGQLNIKNNK